MSESAQIAVLESCAGPGVRARTTRAQTAASHSEGDWSLIIRPKSGWFDLHLQDLWRYRDLVALFVRRDFVATYK